jgi:structural maintenance of chromosomes protein 6
LFGDVIAIERRFSKDGGSGYKIKSKSGQTISTKREDLDEILDHFNLQVDNPMTVLTQDTARQFLGNSSAQDKYKLFMRGVQLSQLDTDYTMVEGQISTLQITLDNKTGPLNDLKELEREWRTKVRIFDRSAEIEENVKNLQNQYAWSQVKDQENVLPHDHLANYRLFKHKLKPSRSVRRKSRD